MQESYERTQICKKLSQKQIEHSICDKFVQTTQYNQHRAQTIPEQLMVRKSIY